MAEAKTTPQFNKLYNGLNKAQKQAVDAIEGPVMVVAGPGTGKTQILTLRIANILRATDVPPDAILALTFTESAVAALRRRLISIIGSRAYRVKIFTFHGFCNDVIARYPDEFPRIIGSEPLSEIDKVTMIRDILTQNDYQLLKPFGSPYHYVSDIRQKIAEVKRENILPEALDSFLSAAEGAFEAIPDRIYTKGQYKGTMKGEHQTYAKKLERSRELLDVYRKYEATLREKHVFDFEDMIVEVVSALKTNKNLLLKLQEEYQYILADEHQDANASQNALLELLSNFHEVPNLFVVGDEKQAIFRFQGASLENFLYFKKRFPDALLVSLTDNYRSGQVILDTAHSVIMAEAGDAVELRTPLTSRTAVSHAHVMLGTFATAQNERAWIAADIAQKIAEGVPAQEIAVLYRTNREAEVYAHALALTGIHVSVESDQNALGDVEIRKLLTVLRAVAHFGNDELLSAALHMPFFGITPLDFYKIARYVRKEHCLIADVAGSRELLAACGVVDIESVYKTFNMLSGWAKGGGSVLALFDTIVRDSGFLAAVLASERAVEVLEKLAGLVHDIETLAVGRPDYSVQDLVNHLALLEEYRIPVRKVAMVQPKTGAVRLMTAHKSKGLEFDYVYIPNAIDGVWGGRSSRESFVLPAGAAQGSDDDERRLLYVALTRARIAVAVTNALEVEGKKDCLPMRFIEEMDPKLLTTIDVSAFETTIRPETQFADTARTAVVLPDIVFLNELFIEQGLSVTALNNYLECPWRYFYSNLVRIPMSPPKHMLYGTAVHAALKSYFDSRINEKRVGKSDLVAAFVLAAGRLPFTREEMAEVLAHGKENLEGWYDEWHTSWNTNVLTEYKITVLLPLADAPHSLRLRGDIDKMEFGNGSAVTVVDYKTGKVRTRNDIQGKTKSSNGDYWRQLVFYKLLLDLEGKYTFAAAELDFLQPDAKNRFHKERFEVADIDVLELKETIMRITGEIMRLDFWNSRCGEADCEYCALRDLMV